MNSEVCNVGALTCFRRKLYSFLLTWLRANETFSCGWLFRLFFVLWRCTYIHVLVRDLSYPACAVALTIAESQRAQRKGDAFLTMTGGLSSVDWQHEHEAKHAILAVRGAAAESLCRLWIGQSKKINAQ